MKKVVLAVAALTVALAGFGSLGAPATQATPVAGGVIVINQNVANAMVGGLAVLTTPAGRAAAGGAAGLAAMARASAAQIGAGPSPVAGPSVIVITTNDPSQPMAVNGKGLVCSPVCDNTATTPPDSDLMKAFTITNSGTFPSGSTVTVIQSNVSLDSVPQTLVGAPHNVVISVPSGGKTTLQEGAASCALTDSTAGPAKSYLDAVYTDIAGNQLVGMMPTWGTVFAAAANAGVAWAAPLTSMLQADGRTISSRNVVCGKAPGTGTVTASPTAAELAAMGAPPGFLVSQAVTVTGLPATIALTASPASVLCDGAHSSTVTATVTDAAANRVVDGTPVTFSVVALGLANPINTTTIGGAASSVITPLAGVTSGVVVTVTSGAAAASILVACQPAPTTAAVTIAHAASDGTSTTIQAKGVGAPKTVYRVDFFWNPTCNPATPGGTYIAAFDDTADASGTFTLNAIVGVFVPPGAIVTATITGPDHVASPFAPCAAVVPRQCTDDSVCNGYTDAQKIALGKDPFNFCRIMRADVNGDGRVDILDLSTMAVHYSELTPPAPIRLDQNADGKINILDLALAASVYREPIALCP
ncbi:MAG: dockerin type I domain-containing protein [Dehalococcoidia bacterium]